MALFLVLPAPVAVADQRDEKLDELFSRLAVVEDISEARLLENIIWQIWHDSDDTAVQVLMREGVAAMSAEDYPRALRKFDQVVQISPGFAEGWNKRATVQFLLGDYDASLHDIRRTLDLEPRHFGALSGRGLVYIRLKDAALALRAFEKALTIHPRLPGAEYNARLLRKHLDDNKI